MNPRHLKASFLSVLALLAALLASSCASSERMSRISYDSDSYSAPKASRISGGRFDDAVFNLRAPAGLKDRQVNVWPFCTVNSRYVSILWPFIDWDDFGMAVRPFFNQEGNEYSILFPLCAWNPVNGDGWALNTYWNDDCFGFFPLMHVGKEEDDFWFVGPVFSGGKDSLGFFPLCYFDYGENHSDGYVGPVWWGVGKEPDDYQFGFWPLYWHLRGGRHTVLFPLYAYENNEYRQHAYFISPLLWMSTGYGEEQKDEWIKGNYLFLGYWRDNWERHGFFPFVNVDRRDGKLSHVLLWWWRKNASLCGLFPFARFDGCSGGLNYVLPAYWRHNEPVYGFFPLVDIDGREERLNNVLLGYWRHDKPVYGFFPFVNIDNRADESFSNVLLWWWRHNSPDCGLFPFAWFHENGGTILPFASWKKHSATGMSGEEETWTEGTYLLLGYWGRNAYGFFPFFRGSSSEADMKYVGPLWWAYDEDEREYGFFPFFRVERTQGETNKSYLFPVYSWEKDRYGSEFSSWLYSREDYDYPEYRATTGVHGRRYLIYSTHGKSGNRFSGAIDRDDYIQRWDFSPSYLDEVRKRMKEDELTAEEAGRETRDAVSSEWEVRTTALHPFFEWTTSDEGERDLRLLLYLFGFDRDKKSSMNWLLWHLLYSSGSEETKDNYGCKETSSHANVLGFFPYWFRDTGAAESKEYDGESYVSLASDYVDECIELLLKRALIEDGSEESVFWTQNVRSDHIGKRYMKDPDAPEQGALVYRMDTPEELKKEADGPFSPAPGRELNLVKTIKPFKLNQIVPGIPNEEIFRVCGMDRALSGEMTAQEAEDTAKRLMDAMLEVHGGGGTDIRTRYGFFPLFLADKAEREKDGETTHVSTEVMTPLTFTTINEEKTSNTVLLGLLGGREVETHFKHANGHASTEDLFTTLVLIRSEDDCVPVIRGSVWALDALADLLRKAPAEGDNAVLAGFWNLQVTRACDKALEEYARFKAITAAVTAYRDGARTAADTQAMLDGIVRWENDYFWKGDTHSSSTGFYPFFFWKKDYLDRDGDISNISKSWFVLPLLSGGSSDDEGSSLGILSPILYFGAEKKHDAALPEPFRILSEGSNPLQASHGGDPVRGRTDHYALFLVGSSDETFVQWKTGTGEAVPWVYQALYQLRRADGMSGFTVAALEQMTIAEVLDLPAEQHEYALKNYKTSLSNTIELMKRSGMKPFDLDAPLMATIETRLRELAAEHIQTRTVSGFNTGWGLTSSSFECKETGDYQSKVLFGLGANSQKIGEKEHKSILGYLYNMDTDGINTRKFIFPFITTKDAPGFHEWSFLGGLFERSVEDGRTGGRIFFFPYGNRPRKDGED